MVILDRPNPNGFYIDGPILEEGFRSNVGLLPIPVVHGLTLGELAKMILGEGWLGAGGNCDLTVIPCENYTHSDLYEIKTAPSPNLKTMEAIFLYPSTCLFENTLVSPGRGTKNPFAIFGSPYLPDNPDYDHIFIPVSMEGAKNPPFEGEECFGKDLSDTPIQELTKGEIDLSYLIKAYRDVKQLYPDLDFFGKPDGKGRYWIDYLMGTDRVRKMITEGADPETIRDSWKDDLKEFEKLRAKYLIYGE